MKRIVKNLEKKLAVWWLLLCGLLANLTAYGAALPNIQVVGLFKDTAIIRSQNKEAVLRTGMRNSDGVRLVSANSDVAIFEFRGQQYRHSLTEVTSFGVAPRADQVRIEATNGTYLLNGEINGRSQNFIVDTGATYVTLGTRQADELGIDYLHSGRVTQLHTANGTADAYLVMVDSVKVGDIEVKQVQAAVLPTFTADKVLLGASFLGNVSMVNQGQVMLLQKK